MLLRYIRLFFQNSSRVCALPTDSLPRPLLGQFSQALQGHDVKNLPLLRRAHLHFYKALIAPHIPSNDYIFVSAHQPYLHAQHRNRAEIIELARP